MSEYKSALHEMACTTKTEFWNDSCSIADLTYAMEYGAVGATTNPVIVGSVLKKEMPLYIDRIKQLISENPKSTEDEIAWLMNEEMAVAGAKLLQPAYEKSGGKNGYISIQTNTKFYNDETKMVEQAVHFNTLAPNIMVKMPVTEAGVLAVEEATYRGVTINATVSFAVAQTIAVAEAVERGLKRREKEGLSTEMSPVCTMMVGRLDDWLKEVAAKTQSICGPDVLEFAGVAAFKNAYRIFKDKGYRTRLLTAAYRNHYQWSELIGGDVSLTIPPAWIKKFNTGDITCENRMDNPVDPDKLAQLKRYFKDFNRAYEPDGMKPAEFNSFGPTQKTLMQFLKGYEEMVDIIRQSMVV